MKNSLAALALISVAAAAAPAHAGTAYGYVCTVALQPATMSTYNGVGTAGDIVLTLNSAPDCGGTQTAYAYFFSTGATYTNTNTTYLYTAAELQAIYQSLVAARNQSTQQSIALVLATTNSIQALWVSLQ
jgi:hypothetical protein